ncbi:hypothetical protein [Microbacterium sp. ZW T5_56]|uniref:hypothetical protein n=1 Tax=Microbacterium sp. ZW T5_56 TaxID=3378081 RepID=UPI0038518530
MNEPTIRLLHSRGHDESVRIRDRRDLHRVRHGVYVSADAWQLLTPWQRYEARVRAFLHKSPDAVLCMESAACLLGLPLFGEPRDIHVLAVDRSSSTRSGDVVFHTSATPRDVIDVDGVLLTSLIDTTVDLGRTLAPAPALAAWDAAARVGCSTDELTDRSNALRTTRGVRKIQWLASFADGRAESPGESVSRAAIAWLGYPAPVLQHEVTIDGENYRGDFWWPQARLWGEFDGYAKYRLESNDKAALRQEKRREDRIRTRVRGFARWDLDDVISVDGLQRALHEAGLRPRMAADGTRLASLRRLFFNQRTL